MGFFRVIKGGDSGVAVHGAVHWISNLVLPFTFLISFFTLSGCVGTESTLDLSSSENGQSTGSSGQIVLSGNLGALTSSNSAITDKTESGQSTAGDIAVPVQSPKSELAPQTNDEPTAQVRELAIAEQSEETSTAGAVIENTLAQSQPAVEFAKEGALEAPKSPGEADRNVSQIVEVSAAPTQDVEKTAKKPAAQNNLFQRLFPNKDKKPVAVAAPKRKINKTLFQDSRGGSGAVRVASAHQTARTKKVDASERQSILISRARAARASSDDALPGVKSKNALFGISRNDEAAGSGNTQLAAVGSFGRLSPNGLRVQHAKVQVQCLKRGVLRVLKLVERRYGSKPIITSGYRSPKRNRRAGGASNSQHIYCKAVDIQVEGVSKWELAKYLRSIPGRGGVGTYCRTRSVHIDIGSKRDWHHPCRRSKVRKRKKA